MGPAGMHSLLGLRAYFGPVPMAPRCRCQRPGRWRPRCAVGACGSGAFAFGWFKAVRLSHVYLAMLTFAQITWAVTHQWTVHRRRTA
jgi:hypothetical protein